jgi:hypothetical protein
LRYFRLLLGQELHCSNLSPPESSDRPPAFQPLLSAEAGTMLTSEPAPAVFPALGSETGALAFTNDPTPEVAVEGLVFGADTGRFRSAGKLAPAGVIPPSEPGDADAGASTLTKVPLGSVPLGSVPPD